MLDMRARQTHGVAQGTRVDRFVEVEAGLLKPLRGG
jgi:hypothetical protein